MLKPYNEKLSENNIETVFNGKYHYWSEELREFEQER